MRWVCSDCIDESYLKAQIKCNGLIRTCEYCSSSGKSISISELADRMETAFNTHYGRLTPLNKPNLPDYLHAEPTVNAFMNAAGIVESIASDVQEILEKRYVDTDEVKTGGFPEFGKKEYYFENKPVNYGWQEEWYNFEDSIKYEERFFSGDAASTLNKVFNFIETINTHEENPIIVEAGPGTKLTHLYRARVFQDDNLLLDAMIRPDFELGAPPRASAKPGRMNAGGISVFYGATSRRTAIAEVRPPVGSKVAVAKFDIIRKLRILDLTAFKKIKRDGSIFDSEYSEFLERAEFLDALCDRISRPIMSDDREMEYLPTQAIAEYLATGSIVPLDGIIFLSEQARTKKSEKDNSKKRLNVVLFHKAAKSKRLVFPEGAEYGAEIDGYFLMEPKPEFSVTKYSADEIASGDFFHPHLRNPSSKWGADEFIHDADGRHETLSINLASMKIYDVEGVKVISSKYDIDRY